MKSFSGLFQGNGNHMRSFMSSLIPWIKGLSGCVNLRLALAGAVILLAPMLSHGVERFPPPEFEPGTYVMPSPTVPPARAHFMEYVDVAVLLLALSMAVYAVHKKRSRIWVFWTTIVSLAYFGFVRQGCICAIGSIQDVTLAVFQPAYSVPVSVIAFFLLPMVFTLYFGRVFCAAVCPLGAAQDLVVWKAIRIKPWLASALGIFPYFYLGAAVLFAATGTSFIICEWDPFVSFFRLSGSFGMLMLGVAFLVVGMFIGRPYCRFLCPYGAVLSLLSRVARTNVTLTNQSCLECKLCEVACPYGAIAAPTPAKVMEQKLSQTTRAMAPLVLLLALFVWAGSWAGGHLMVPFSKQHHTVKVAEQIAAEDAGKAKPDDASKAYRGTGKPVADLYKEALRIQNQFHIGGMLLGAFAGLVAGLKLISLAVPAHRTVYEPDAAECVACGRCYSYCPKVLTWAKREEKKTMAKQS